MHFFILIPVSSNAGEPKQTTATYGDWTVRCATRNTDTGRICELVQSVRTRGNRGILTQIAIGKLPGAKVMKMVFQVPTNVLLANGVTLTLDGTDVLNANFLFCTPSSCLAELEFTAEIQTKLQQAKKAAIKFVMVNRKDISVPMSLKGFADAFIGITK